MVENFNRLHSKWNISEKNFYAIILILLFSLYSSIYIFNVVMPQNGWWHYIAWRCSEGDILYKDIFLFIPPYFTMITQWFYSMFERSFVFYTIFVGFPIKILCLLLIYYVLCRRTHPFYSCISVLFGACISSTYQMDVWYDYNPVIMLPSLLVAFLLMKYNDYLDNAQKRLVLAFLIGVLLGGLLMLKQIIGLSFLAAVIIILGILHFKEKVSMVLLSYLVLFGGILIGVMPAVIYFINNECFQEFINCMIIAVGAKGGTGGLFNNIKDTMFQLKKWILVLPILMFLFVPIKNWLTFKFKYFYEVILLIGCLVLGYVLFYVQANEQLYFIVQFLTKPRNLSAIVFVVSGIILLEYIKYKKSMTEYFEKLALFYIVTLFFIILYWKELPVDYHNYIYNQYHVFGIRRAIITIFSYVFSSIWIYELYRYFIKKASNGSIAIFMTIIYVHFLSGIVSTSVIEELFMVLYMPWVVVYLFNRVIKCNVIKDGIIIVFLICNIMMSITSKIVIPYDWQGWRTPSIVGNEINSDIHGLEVYLMNQMVSYNFKKVVDLINEHTTEEDTILQFANIPMFNVLTERKIPTYAPIGWFDVCPDEVAISDARFLYDNNPKMIIWNNMSDQEWDLLEKVFRNGRPSGQRDIKVFYEQIVLNKYKLLHEFSNNRDGTIQIFVKN